jgi:hypothetical protein
LPWSFGLWVRRAIARGRLVHVARRSCPETKIPKAKRTTGIATTLT